MQSELQKLIDNGDVVVGVYQQHDKGKKALVNYWQNEETNYKQLLCFLYRKAILKDNRLKIRYSYNYSDKQTISIIESFENFDGSITKTSFVFYNVPTKCGYLNIL